MTVGGGSKKILYTLKTVGRIGLLDSARALNSNNACKACGLGMGGQRGGMTNELGEFPSVCNKSVQAQSTDIQPGIPPEVFQHSLAEFRELSRYELEHLGRVAMPLYKAAGANHYQPITWPEAIQHAAKALANTPAERSFFYSSGRSSNEAGFVLQLLARLHGSNNVNNCSFYCHQATGVGLKATIGTGTATVELADLGRSDCVFLFGANPASNHPRLIHQLKGVRDRGGQVIVVNPAKEPGLVRFAVPKSAKSLITGGTWIASDYLQPAIGSDVAVCLGIAKAVLALQAQDQPFIEHQTDNFADYVAQISSTSWQALTNASGLSQADFERVAASYASANRVIFAWGMGVTHHLHGVANVEAIASLALLRGMIGRPGAGLLPLRGHSNVQGIGSMGVKPVLADDVFQHMEQHLGVTLPRTPGKDTIACLRAAHQGNMDVALIMGGNLFDGTPDRRWATEALDRIGCKLFLTTTLNRGHVTGVDKGAALILPVAARDEEWQATTQESMFNYVRLSDGGIRRLPGVRPEVTVLCDIAAALFPDGAINWQEFRQHNSIRAAIAAAIPGMAGLRDIGDNKQEFTIPGRILHQATFPTASGRASFKVPPLPSSQANASYPFLLASVRSEGQFNSIIYEERDSYRGADHRQVLFMGPDDMARLGLAKGDRVCLRSAQGELPDLQVLPFDLPAGSLLSYYPEANVLTSAAHDPRSKTPAFKSVPVAVDLPVA